MGEVLQRCCGEVQSGIAVFDRSAPRSFCAKHPAEVRYASCFSGGGGAAM